MTNEKVFFLIILSDHLAGKKTVPRQNIDWNMLLKLAQTHQVMGIVFYQCSEFMPPPVYAVFQKAYKVALYYYKNRESDYQSIDKRFTAAGIRHFTVKGLEVAACFPVPALRTMGDLDVIVSRSDKKRAGEILTALGFTLSREQSPDHDWGYNRNRLHYELHHQLIYDEVVTKANQAQFFNNFWNYVKDGKLDWNFHFLYLIAHLRKHMLNSGAGFRMFMDLAAVIQYIPNLNCSWIEEQLAALEMARFAQVCFALMEKWFGIQPPLFYLPLEREFVEVATEKIFANGIFGFNDEKNKLNGAINGILRYENKRGLSRAIMTLRFLFPKYDHLRYISTYRFVDGKPWLMPLAWMYRFVRLFTGASGGLRHSLERVTASSKDIDNRETELRSWGLK